MEQQRRVPLDMNAGSKYYSNWRADGKLQAIRAQLQFLCVHGIKMYDTRCRCPGDTKSDSELSVLQNLIPDLLDWIVAIGVCPVAVNVTEKDPMRRVFVPDYNRVQVFRVIPPFGPVRYEVEWRALCASSTGPGDLFGALGSSKYDTRRSSVEDGPSETHGA